jgi:hypothetical protein
MPTKKAQQKTTIDLDKLEQKDRAERDAKGGLGGPVVKFKGEDFVLADDLPLEVVIALGEVDDTDRAEVAKVMIQVIRVLFDDDDWTRFLALKPSMNNLLAMYEQVFAAYAGANLGESKASDKSSPNTGTQPRQSSKRATAST